MSYTLDSTAQTHADNVIIGAGVAMSSEVTFHDFAALANRKGWTPESLALFSSVVCADSLNSWPLLEYAIHQVEPR